MPCRGQKTPRYQKHTVILRKVLASRIAVRGFHVHPGLTPKKIKNRALRFLVSQYSSRHCLLPFLLSSCAAGFCAEGTCEIRIVSLCRTIDASHLIGSKFRPIFARSGMINRRLKTSSAPVRQVSFVKFRRTNVAGVCDEISTKTAKIFPTPPMWLCIMAILASSRSLFHQCFRVRLSG